MKIIYRSVFLIALLIVASCGKDSAEDAAQQQQQEAEQLEQIPLEANDVSDNVIIAGATKEEGTPPTPNEAIAFDTSGTSTMALLNEGFEVNLSSEANIVGAYIRFKSNDGTAADSYYDINLNFNAADKKVNKSKLRSKKTSSSAKIDETTLDVDFSSAIPPGTICYEICVYDAENNISAPEEVCVTVESWGGNADLVDTWNLTKEVETLQESTTTLEPGDEDCSEEAVIDCNDGGQFTASYFCYVTDFFTLVFNTDGTYEWDSKDFGNDLMITESKETCEPIFEETTYTYKSKGNWAYNQEAKKLIMIEYEYTRLIKSIAESKTFDPGDGLLLFDSVIDLEGNSLLIKSVDDADEKYHLYFEK